jgi:hypothetical protein
MNSDYAKIVRIGAGHHFVVCVYNLTSESAKIGARRDGRCITVYVYMWHVAWRLKARTGESEKHLEDGSC